MTKDYSHAISWIENHNTPDEYEDGEYHSWFEDSREMFANPEIFDSPDFKQSMERLWNNYHDEIQESDSDNEYSDSGIREINTGTGVINKGTITKEESPVKVESKTPIRITPINRPVQQENIPVAVVVPKNIPVQQKQSIFKRFISLFRRRR